MEYQDCEPCSQHHPNAWESIPGRAFPHGQGLFPVVNVTFPGGHIQMHHLNSSLPYINLILFWLPTAGFPWTRNHTNGKLQKAKSCKPQPHHSGVWASTQPRPTHPMKHHLSHPTRAGPMLAQTTPKGTEKGTKLFLSPTTVLCLLKEYNSVRLL